MRRYQSLGSSLKFCFVFILFFILFSELEEGYLSGRQLCALVWHTVPTTTDEDLRRLGPDYLAKDNKRVRVTVRLFQHEGNHISDLEVNFRVSESPMSPLKSTSGVRPSENRNVFLSASSKPARNPSADVQKSLLTTSNLQYDDESKTKGPLYLHTFLLW
jgi:hypothetical protein